MLRVRSLVTAGIVAGVTACATTVLAAAPAVADSRITVRGTGFPEGRLAQLSMVGCTTLYDRSAEPLAPFIGRGPDRAPLGTRSLGYDLQGGNAVGSLHYVGSMLATTTAELSVHAADGSQGVAYAGYQAPSDAGTPDVWIGRAAISAPAGTWSQVDAGRLTYTWTKYDMATHEVVTPAVPGTAATVARWAAGHGGDGPGFYTIGFGCDGARFSMDAWRIGPSGDVTSYDLEGLTTTTSIAGSSKRVEAGDEVRLTGQLRLGTGDRLRSGTLMLESKPVGRGEFEVVEVLEAAAGDPSYVVRPTESTVYRYRFADRPLAEGSVSTPFVVTVAPDAQTPDLPEPPDPTDQPSEEPSDEPSEEPSEEPSDEPSEEPSDEPTDAPTDEPDPTQPPEEPPTEGPTSPPPSGEPGEPSPSPTFG